MVPEQAAPGDSKQVLTETRGQRKKRETRQRIVEVAESLMRSRPIDDITIQDVTEAADVGHGTFYLHFKSKYEVLVPIVQAQALRQDEIIRNSLGELTDSAEIMAFSARHMARVIAADPLWRWFIQHSGVPVEDMRDALGRFSARDFGRGLMSGRFNVPELTVGSSFLFGGFVSGLLTSLETTDPETAIDQMVEMMLRGLGLPAAEAKEIAHRPLHGLTQ